LDATLAQQAFGTHADRIECRICGLLISALSRVETLVQQQQLVFGKFMLQLTMHFLHAKRVLQYAQHVLFRHLMFSAGVYTARHSHGPELNGQQQYFRFVWCFQAHTHGVRSRLIYGVKQRRQSTWTHTHVIGAPLRVFPTAVTGAVIALSNRLAKQHQTKTRIAQSGSQRRVWMYKTTST
jgi:hypothetical protein